MTRAKGWKARQEAAKQKMILGNRPVIDTDVYRVRQDFPRAQEAESKAQAEASQNRIRQSATVCPCCQGRGHVLVNDAAVIVESVERYKSAGWAPAVETIAKLLKGAFSVDKDGVRVAETETVIPAETAEDEHAETVEEAIAQLDAPPKPRRRR